MLIDMASDDFIATFIGERWKATFKKKTIPDPKSLAYNRVLRPIWDGEVLMDSLSLYCAQ
jgi:hypothetical protein